MASSSSDSLKGLPVQSVAVPATILVASTIFLKSALDTQRNVDFRRVYFAALLLVFGLASAWATLVNKFVPEPYLDEVFHIPQAQTYCDDRFFDWDDKITTPPGLYLYSRALITIKSTFAPWIYSDPCSAGSLRHDNISATLGVFVLAVVCRCKIEKNLAGGIDARRRDDNSPKAWVYAVQTGLNISLFPVLFFFSGLYYTDVLSTMCVLIAYSDHLNRVGNSRPRSVLGDVWTILLGVLVLFMRQTNIFWVVVYMGGVEAVHAIKSIQPKSSSEEFPVRLHNRLLHLTKRAAAGEIHDPSLSSAWPHDLLFCALSIGIAALANPLRVLRHVWPRITIMALFAGFVLWNGGVVLGDKSNHVATIHLPQMLYIWPLFAFFSFPLFIPTLFVPLHNLYRGYAEHGQDVVKTNGPKDSASINGKTKTTKLSEEKSSGIAQQTCLFSRVVDTLLSPAVYYAPLTLATLVGTWAIIRKNTIVHPFTLADNRHYMFYIFRYTIRRPGRFREYLLVIYTICRWLCWGALAPAPVECDSTSLKSMSKTKTKSEQIRTQNPTPGPNDISSQPAASSTAVLWFVATTLSLMTAPLVEPRYFILPWIFWRILLPAWRLPQGKASGSDKNDDKTALRQSRSVEAGRWVDQRALLEMAWFLIVNAVTMYVFLTRPYVWLGGEGGVLDGGKLQRFMW